MKSYKPILVLAAVLGVMFVGFAVTGTAALAQDAGALVDAGPAAEAAPNSAAGELLLDVLKIIFGVVGLLSTWLVAKGISWVEKKTKFDIPDSAERLVHNWVEKGIGLAHEKSHQALQATGERLRGPEKMEIALGFVKRISDSYNFPQLAEDKLKDYIEAKLGVDRTDENKTLIDEGV